MLRHPPQQGRKLEESIPERRKKTAEAAPRSTGMRLWINQFRVNRREKQAETRDED